MCSVVTDFMAAFPTLTESSCYFGEILVVILGGVNLYVKYLCTLVHGCNPHYASGLYGQASNLSLVMRV